MTVTTNSEMMTTALIDTIQTGDAATDELMAAITAGINKYMLRRPYKLWKDEVEYEK